MLGLLDLQPAQLDTIGPMTDADLQLALSTGYGLAGFHNGKLLGFAGIAKTWQGRGLVWALLSRDIGRVMTPVHRAVAGAIKDSSYDRLEAHVDMAHVEGHRWVTLLGFQREGVMRRFHEGRDYALYARLRP